jgi:hypothetical protein
MNAANKARPDSDTCQHRDSSGWLLVAAAFAVVCCAGPIVLAGLGAGLVAGALGAWLGLAAVCVPIVALLAGAGAVWVRRRRR